MLSYRGISRVCAHCAVRFAFNRTSFGMSEDLRAEVRRNLTSAERELLRWVLEHSAAEPEPYLEQIPRLRVVGQCGCGCPTVDLVLEGEPHSGDKAARLIAEADGQSPEGVPVGVLVFAKDAVPSVLEVYSITGDAPFSLPLPDALTPAPPEQHA